MDGDTHTLDSIAKLKGQGYVVPGSLDQAIKNLTGVMNRLLSAIQTLSTEIRRIKSSGR